MIEFISICIFLVLFLVVARINIRQIKSKKLLGAILLLPFSITLLTLNVLFMSFILDQDSYERLTKEHTIATIKFQQIKPQQFNATIHPALSEPISVTLNGDQWQLDTRIIKWKGPPTYFGLQPMYLLERLSGRYETIEDEKNKTRSVVTLDMDQSFDYWNLLVKYQHMVPWLDAHYGSAVYLPMKDNATFMITLGQHGQIVRPRNLNASNAIKNWFVPIP